LPAVACRSISHCRVGVAHHRTGNGGPRSGLSIYQPLPGPLVRAGRDGRRPAVACRSISHCRASTISARGQSRPPAVACRSISHCRNKRRAPS